MYIGLEVIDQKHIKFNCASFWISLVFAHQKVVESSFFHQMLYFYISLLPMASRKAKVLPPSSKRNRCFKL